MLLWVMDVGFENTCAVSGKWNVQVVPRLYRWVYKILRLANIRAEVILWLRLGLPFGSIPI